MAWPNSLVNNTNQIGGYNPYGVVLPQQQYPQMQQSNQNPIVWVQGESGAKAYPVQPGASVLLMDSEGEYFFIKSSDNAGIPQPLRKFSYKEVTGGSDEPKDIYVTREEFEKKIAELSRRKNDYRRGDRNE